MSEVSVRAARQLLDKLTAAWVKNSGEDFGAPFLDDAHFVAFDGTVLNRPEAIAKYHQEAFDRYLKGTRLVVSIASTCTISSDAVLVFMNGHIESTPGGSVELTGESVQTMVVVSRAGAARIQAFQNTRERPITSDASAKAWKDFDQSWKQLG